MLGHIDSPAAGSLVPGHVLVRGWAYSASSPVSKVEIHLDGRRVGRAGLRRPRPDVAAALSDPRAELSGFEFYLDLSDIEGRARLSAHVAFLDDRVERLPEIDFEVAPARAIDPILDREDASPPRTLSGLSLASKRSTRRSSSSSLSSLFGLVSSAVAMPQPRSGL